MQCGPIILLSLIVGLFAPWPELLGISALDTVTLPDICKLPVSIGSCRGSIPRFFFNTETMKCEKFIFGGCEPNANNFLKYASCYQECGRFAGIPRICKIAKSHGSCRGNYPRYFFNVKTLECEKFIYSGCGGTENNFVSLTDCTHVCESYVIFPSRCRLTKVVGKCKESNVRYFFNMSTKKCERFIHRGCGGNANRFETQQECEFVCQYFVII
ncbi:tissue factor pathway inhibitor 2 [Podarcis lilfordi]|uniref:Tissue factor pathway inhibitor 2 n=1 Tax=Podarcis lilfordi TaxID=74358 RepID=A0AA35LGH9_9SAUR|nr:tissue factor pathway inhibitor 2 [Podarcis lilfordi]